MKAHLNTLASENYDIEVGQISGTSDEVSITVKIRYKGAVSSDRKLLEAYANIHGLDLEKNSVVQGAGCCKLIGFKPRNTKIPWIVENVNGKTYKIATSAVSLHLKAA